MTMERITPSLTHAHIKRIVHPRLGVEVDGGIKWKYWSNAYRTDGL